MCSVEVVGEYQRNSLLYLLRSSSYVPFKAVTRYDDVNESHDREVVYPTHSFVPPFSTT